MRQVELRRRDFLHATTVTGVAAALSASVSPGLVRAQPARDTGPASKDAGPATKIVKTQCRACISNCGVLAHVRDGRVIKLEGNPEDPMSKGAMCAKGLSGIQALYHPSRNKYPMKRVGKRGENKWQRISWEEALDTIAKKLMETREKYGAEAVLGSTGGGGNPNFLSVARFLDVFGSPNWFEPGAAQCYMPRQLVYMLMYGGGGSGNTSIADSNCLELYYPDETPIKALVLWGTGPSYSTPPCGGQALVELRARGVKTVVIDPRMTPDAAKADIWLPIRPGTDVALMSAWIKHIIDKKLYDADFVMKWTNLPYLVDVKTKMFLRESDLKPGGSKDTFVVWDRKTNTAQPLPYPFDDNLDPALAGSFTVNGVACKTGFQLLAERVEPFTIAKAAEICWLDAKKIEEAIDLYVRNSPSGIILGVATDHNPNSTQSAMGAAALDLMMGNVEKPGTLLQRFTDGAIRDLRSTPLKDFLSEAQLNKRLGNIEHKGLLTWWTGQPAEILKAMATGKPYPLKVWIDRSGNKLAMVAEPHKWVEALANLDLIVHIYMYPTSFSAYADILLPATEWLETDFVVRSMNKLFARRAVTHLWETMNETAIFPELAKRCAKLGHEDCKRSFDAKATAPEQPYFDTYDQQLDAWTDSAIKMTWKEFVEKAPVDFCPFDKWKVYYVYKQIDPKTGKPLGFGTPSKKCEVYMESMITLARTGVPLTTYPLPPASKDYDPLLYYMEPHENPKADIGKTYPLVMTNGRLPMFHHGTLRNIPWLREICPVPELWVHPDDAKTSGVAHGDWLWVESQRGKIQARARVTVGMAPGVVYMERFWNPEGLGTPTQGWQEMNVNILSSASPPYNDVCGTYTLRGYQVKISKAGGPPPGVWYKPEQYAAWLPQPTDATKPVEVRS